MPESVRDLDTKLLEMQEKLEREMREVAARVESLKSGIANVRETTSQTLGELSDTKEKLRQAAHQLEDTAKSARQTLDATTSAANTVTSLTETVRRDIGLAGDAVRHAEEALTDTGKP